MPPDGGSAELWSLAESFNSVPVVIRRDTIAGDLIHQWWAAPRRPRCAHAARSWRRVVLLPNPGLLCLMCGGALIGARQPTRCALCADDLHPGGEHPHLRVSVEHEAETAAPTMFVLRMHPDCIAADSREVI